MSATIVIYTQSHCQPCAATKRWLDVRAISYLEVALSALSPEQLDTFREQGHLSAPIVVSPVATFSGFRPSALAALADAL